MSTFKAVWSQVMGVMVLAVQSIQVAIMDDAYGLKLQRPWASPNVHHLQTTSQMGQ
jgi:hypothetical protein